MKTQLRTGAAALCLALAALGTTACGNDDECDEAAPAGAVVVAHYDQSADTGVQAGKGKGSSSSKGRSSGGGGDDCDDD